MENYEWQILYIRNFKIHNIVHDKNYKSYKKRVITRACSDESEQALVMTVTFFVMYQEFMY